jgi:hypothetical protein
MGLEVLFDKAFEDEVVDRLTQESLVHINRDRRGWSYSVRYGDMSGTWYALPHYDDSTPPTEREILKDTFGRYCTALISDACAAQKLRLPLLQAGATPFLNYSRPGADPMDQLVALELRLPVITNIPLKDVLHLREKHSAEFERFRSALQKAIKEQLARTDTEAPEVVAREVVDEYVTPELSRIESELKVDQKALAKKIGANVVVAGASVSIGALASIPLVIASGIAAIIPSFGPINKYFDDRGKIELSDFYFLWRARVKYSKHNR